MATKNIAVPINEKTLQSFRSTLRGNLIRRGDEGYEAARAVYNGMINRYPAMIVLCGDVADVMSAVNFSTKTN